MTKRTWRLDLTDEQFDCILTGMELYHRLLCGDLNQLVDISPHGVACVQYLGTLKSRIFPELGPGETYSWNGGSPTPYFDTQQAQSYQIYREMLHRKTLAEGLHNVYSSETLRTEKAEQPKITRLIK